MSAIIQGSCYNHGGLKVERVEPHSWIFERLNTWTLNTYFPGLEFNNFPQKYLNSDYIKLEGKVSKLSAMVCQRPFVACLEPWPMLTIGPSFALLNQFLDKFKNQDYFSKFSILHDSNPNEK